jgi:hypothetical protein
VQPLQGKDGDQMSIQEYLINKLITSGFLKSRILAWTRIGAAALGTYLVTKGVANYDIANTVSGAVVSIVSLYLQDLDVKVVDGKIKIALKTDPASIPPDVTYIPPNNTPVEIHVLPPIEKIDEH